MSGFQALFSAVQIFFIIIIGLYFFNLFRSQNRSKRYVEKESRAQMEKLRKMRAISLTEPLTEKTRPDKFSEIVGQEDGLKALRAALCGPNPQHVIIYGPPGVGKTATARLVLEEAKKSELSPFKKQAKFIEVDATVARFDERGIADPLIGCVHDPIYQGAGHMGQAGIPQPKPGAVTKAHGGVLFIDEIGELHNIQMNKLLKVLEDRRVFLESSYYNSEDENMPEHIHDIFKNGLPADFRLIGATTRQPEDINPAIRSRCIEIYFKSLEPEQLVSIAVNTCNKVGFKLEDKALAIIKKYTSNGREVVNLIQTAVGLAVNAGSDLVKAVDVEWIVQNGQYSPRHDRKIRELPQVGVVNGLAVCGPNQGILEELEVSVIKTVQGKGKVIITGIIEEEESSYNGKKYRSKSMIKCSAENVCTVLKKVLRVKTDDYDIHINFSGGIPVNGPSAGITMAVAIYSAISEKAVDNYIAMTGELSVHGLVKPVGGILAKIEAARKAGVKSVIIPKANFQEIFASMDNIKIIAVEKLEEVIEAVISEEKTTDETKICLHQADILSAAPSGR